MPETLMNRIVALILLLLFLALMVSFLTTTKDHSEDYIIHKKCRDSVFLHSAAKKLKIDADDGLECGTSIKEIATESDREFKGILKKEAYWCGWQYWFGTKELYSRDGKYCSICSHIVLKRRRKTTVDIKDIFPEQEDKRKGSYRDDFGKAGELHYTIPESQKSDFDIDSEKNDRYDIVFVYYKGRDVIKDVMKKGAWHAGTTLAGVGIAYGGLALSGGTLCATGAGCIVTIVGGIIIVGGNMATNFFVQDPPEWLSMRVLIPHSEKSLKGYGCEELAQPVKGLDDGDI